MKALIIKSHVRTLETYPALDAMYICLATPLVIHSKVLIWIQASSNHRKCTGI